MRYGLTTKDFWNPAREFSPWFSEIDEVMDRLLVPMTTLKRETQSFNPACDVEETDSHYLMSFDLPGISKEDVKIEVVDNQLTVSGERKTEKKGDKNSRHVAERYYGSFQRVVMSTLLANNCFETKHDQLRPGQKSDGMILLIDPLPSSASIAPDTAETKSVKKMMFIT